MEKRNLQKRIMENVQRALMKTLNEDFQFDDTEVADKLLEIVKKDKQIQHVVENANANDWTNVLRGMVKLIKNNSIPENPAKIANIVQLATALLQRGIDSKLQEKMKEFTFDDMQYTANFLVKEISKNVKSKNALPSEKSENESKSCTEGEVCDKCGKNPCQCKGKECGENCGSNKKVQEARNFKVGGFSKYLNENNLSIRPGKKQKVDEDFKSAAVGAAMGAAALVGNPGKASATPMNGPMQNQEAKVITVTPKFSEQELIKIFPQAYKDRFADKNVWSRNRVKYEGKLPNSNKISFVGKYAAIKGQNPWWAIVDKYLDEKPVQRTIAFNDVK